jgi:radical SAM superfamily enzyme YgiQ (UPF0313 family)
LKIVLVYPYFHPAKDNSIFRFPPLGLGYLAAALRQRGVEVDLVDCTFLKFNQALSRIQASKPDLVGFYCMFSMKKTTMQLAGALRAGGLGVAGLWLGVRCRLGRPRFSGCV